MAAILSAKLSIKVTSSTAAPTVTYRLSFSQGELNLMKNFPGLFRVRCELWGSDSGFNGADDKLFIYPVTRSYPDATVTAIEEGTFTATLHKGAELNEDNSFFDNTDEIYAKVLLINTFANTTLSKKSNQVVGQF